MGVAVWEWQWLWCIAGLVPTLLNKDTNWHCFSSTFSTNGRPDLRESADVYISGKKSVLSDKGCHSIQSADLVPTEGGGICGCMCATKNCDDSANHILM